MWNTWTRGNYDATMGGFKTHTHFVTMKELEILRGLSKRGVFFARKLSQKKTSNVIDALDMFIDESNSEQGKYWPGYSEYIIKQNKTRKN